MIWKRTPTDLAKEKTQKFGAGLLKWHLQFSITINLTVKKKISQLCGAVLIKIIKPLMHNRFPIKILKLWNQY